jgi:hypothetical protein
MLVVAQQVGSIRRRHVGCTAGVMQRLVPELIERAASLLGGLDALAKHLGVPEHAVRLWSTARATAPQDVLVNLVDLILKDDIARAAQDRRSEPRRPESGAGAD